MDNKKGKRSHVSSKKHKKHKKHKKSEKRSHSSDSNSDSDEVEWVEAASGGASKEKRDEWMNEESFVSTLSRDEMMSGSSRERRREAQAQKREQEEEIHKDRELNPHWKNEGTGLPQEEASNLRLPTTSVGDGGYGYLKKAYMRIQEQAQREGRTMEEVAIERWGSLNKLVSMIEEAEARMKQHSTSRYHYKDNWKEKSTSKSFKEPSPCESSSNPEKSFRFEKPRDYERNRKKIGKFTSSDLKKRYISYSDQMDDIPRASSSTSDNRKNEKNSISDHSNISNRSKNYFAWEKSSKDSSPDRARDQPKWKKLSRDSSPDGARDQPRWKKTSRVSSPDETRDQPRWKKSSRNASPDRSREPRWKKSSRDSSPDEARDQPRWKKTSRDSSPDEARDQPRWKKSSRNASPDRSREPRWEKSSKDTTSDRSEDELIQRKPVRDSSSDRYKDQPAWKKSSNDLLFKNSREDQTEQKNLSRDSSPNRCTNEQLPRNLLPDRSSNDLLQKKTVGASEESSTLEKYSFNPDKKMESALTVIQTEDDLNRLAAAFLRAELRGDKIHTTELKAQFDEATEAFKSGVKYFVTQPSAKSFERVLLTKVDSSGLERPIQSSREDAGFERRMGHKKTVNKYFDEGSKYSLKQMFEREKLTTADDNLEMFLDVAAEAKETNDDNETSGISRKASHKMSHGIQEEKDIGRAIRLHQKRSSALEKCEYCLDNRNMKRHLIVTIRKEVYMCIPNYQSLTDGHCLIIPKRHVPSFLALDEDEWEEVEELKSLLRNMFRSNQKSLLCLETSMTFGRCPHAFIECIPVPEEEGHMAPMYFKKAILESEEEWAHNVKLVDLAKKGLRRSIPKNLPYFCIMFDPSIHAGFAHVIEDEKCFPRNFGKEVIGGMLDIDYNELYKNRREDPIKKSNETLLFTRSLEKFIGEDL